RCDAVERLVQAGRPRVTIVDVPTAPLEFGERFSGKGELADRSGQTPRLRPRETQQRFSGSDGRAGVDAALRGGHVTQIEVLIEGLIAEVVVDAPRVPGVIDTARKTVGVVVERRKEVARIGPDVAAPRPWRAEKVRRARREEGSTVGRAVVIEIETKVFGGVQGEVGRAELPHG